MWRRPDAAVGGGDVQPFGRELLYKALLPWTVCSFSVVQFCCSHLYALKLLGLMLLCLRGVTLLRTGRCCFHPRYVWIRLRSVLFYFVVSAAHCVVLWFALIVVARCLLVQLGKLFHEHFVNGGGLITRFAFGDLLKNVTLGKEVSSQRMVTENNNMQIQMKICFLLVAC